VRALFEEGCLGIYIGGERNLSVREESRCHSTVVAISSDLQKKNQSETPERTFSFSCNNPSPRDPWMNLARVLGWDRINKKQHQLERGRIQWQGLVRTYPLEDAHGRGEISLNIERGL